MNTYIYASSRGKSLDMGDIFVKAKPGGKLMTLYKLAKRHLMHINGTKLVYFVCGLPDICTLSRKEYPLYEESHIDMTSRECDLLKAYTDQMIEVENGLKQLNCKIIFATVTTMNFEKWNRHRLMIRNKGTTYLNFESEYDAMQNRLNSTLTKLNQFITELSVKNCVFTPFLHSYVHQRCSGGRLRYKYTKLVDGVHPSSDLVQKWQSHLLKVIQDNESKLIS